MKSFAKLGAVLALVCLGTPAPAGDVVKLNATAQQTDFVITGFDGRFLSADVYGAGQGSHIGDFTYFAPHVFDFGTGGFDAMVQITASNGDTLSMETVGQLISTTDSYSTYTIVGGTGRFLNATGTGTIYNMNGSLTLSGTICTVGSSK